MQNLYQITQYYNLAYMILNFPFRLLLTEKKKNYHGFFWFFKWIFEAGFYNSPALIWQI